MRTNSEINCVYILHNVTLDHKTSLKSLGYIYSNSQNYIVWVKIVDFPFMPKIIRTLRKIHIPIKKKNDSLNKSFG